MRGLILFILLCASFTAIDAQSQLVTWNYVYGFNLSNQLMDVRLGNAENYVFQFRNMKNGEYQLLTTISREYSDMVYYKASNTTEWQILDDELGWPIDIDLKNGTISCFYFNKYGEPGVVRTNINDGLGAKVCFANFSDTHIDALYLTDTAGGTDYNYAADLPSESMTDFLVIPRAKYNVTWETPGDTADGTCSYTIDNSGNRFYVDYELQHYYLVILLPDGSGGIVSEVVDITK